MAVFKCKMCGGDLEIAAGLTVAECEYCGTKQTLPKANDEVVQNLFNRANNLRIKCEFDKAEQIYEKILQENDAEAEAHWGIVLCKYGIEYVEDPKIYKRIPTCHRTSYEAVTTDTDYLAALAYADPEQKSIYEAEARAIDEIQKNILNIVKNEKPFDVFICYKESDENGKRTQDSVIANDIYYQLTQEGLKVFYAAITLEDKLGQEYEPYIFAALNSAKVMLVVGSKPQYFSAVWVKNEWSRFLKLMKSDRSKLLIPCYKDMDAYDLPEEFSHLQAQDMSKIGFINDVVRGIKKVIGKDDSKETASNETAVSGNASITPLLKRAFMFLEDGDWNGANEYCEKVLDVDPENAQAYLAKLMAELRVRKQESLQDCANPFDDSNNYQKALRFGDAQLKAKLEADIEHIKTRNEEARIRGIYESAVNQMASANSESVLKGAAVAFESISDYKDAAELAKQCLEKAEEARKNAILAEGERTMKAVQVTTNYGVGVATYREAITILRKVSGWKNADAQIEKCEKNIRELEEKEEKRKQEAELARQEAVRIAKRNRKIAMLTATGICVVIAFVILLNTVIIPNKKYNDAIALMEEGKYTEAVAAFEALGGYKDSVNMAKECQKTIINNIKVGDSIFFGVYKQDNDTSSGNRDIEWIVLKKHEDQVLLISKYALDCKQYNSYNANVTWMNCTLRSWLNSEFINTAFTAAEKKKILTVTVPADENPEYNTNVGNATRDQVFLLSIAEANECFASDSMRVCQPTQYAVQEGAWTSVDGNCWWWLRTPGDVQKSAAGVGSDGGISGNGSSANSEKVAVRPAMWVDLGVGIDD